MEPTGSLDADVIVVGAGMGGGAAALRLAERGLSVIVLEAGPGEDVVTMAGPTRFERMRRGLARSPIQAPPDPTLCSYYLADPHGTGTLRPAPTRLGRGVGGSSQFYASALERFRRSDLEQSAPGRSQESALPNAWPVDFDELSAYYAQAESLLRVRGEPDPLDPDATELPGDPLPPLTSGSVKLRGSLAQRGLHPYRLHVGIDYVPDCGECFASRCLRACKADGNNRLLVRALGTGRVRLEVDTRADEITVSDEMVRVLSRGPSGERAERRASRVVVAAGALGTPLLLDRSESLWSRVPRPAMLGRGLMFHLTDSWAVNVHEDSVVPKKWLGLRDFYGDGVHDAGEIQSGGWYLTPGLLLRVLRSRIATTPLRHIPSPLLMPFAWAAARLMGRRPIFAAITEDLPHERNRVWEENGEAVVSYTVDPLLRQRSTAFRSTVLQAFGPRGVLFTAPPSEPNWGHPMGTCRMGTDVAVSVTTAEGQLHGHPRIYVADASTFPSSGGAGPALTVAALALRVADRLADQDDARSLGQTGSSNV